MVAPAGTSVVQGRQRPTLLSHTCPTCTLQCLQWPWAVPHTNKAAAAHALSDAVVSNHSRDRHMQHPQVKQALLTHIAYATGLRQL